MHITQMLDKHTRIVQSCPVGWNLYNEHCFLFRSDDHVTFSMAADKCSQVGGNLTSIHSHEELQYIVSRMLGSGDVQTEFWIGRIKEENGSRYEWLYESEEDFEDLVEGNVDTTETGRCMTLHTNDAGNAIWRQADCARFLGYVCKQSEGHHKEVSLVGLYDGKCPDLLWEQYNSSCLLFRPSILRTWETAEEDCQRLGGHLATIDSDEENSFIHNRMNTKWNGVDILPRYWIGLNKKSLGVTEEEMEKNMCLRYGMRHHPMCVRDRYDPAAYERMDKFFADRLRKQYIWEDGNDGKYMNWAAGEPNAHYNRENCVEVLRTGEWNDGACSADNHGYVCKAPLHLDTNIVRDSSPTPVSGQCLSEEWEDIGNKCLFYQTAEPMSWDSGALYCAKLGGMLVKVQSDWENQLIYQQMSAHAHAPDVSYWIGLSRNDTGSRFLWEDGTGLTDYMSWGPHEPSEEEGELCVQISSSTRSAGEWRDSVCDNLRGFVCQTDKVAVPDSHDEGKGLSRVQMIGIVCGIPAAVSLVLFIILLTVTFYSSTRDYIKLLSIKYIIHDKSTATPTNKMHNSPQTV